MLQEKAMTVNLTVNQWTARKHDKKITAEVEQTHNAKDAGRYNKMLVEKDTLQKIQKTANAARTFHYENTLPWGDNGDRLLPSANYLTYVGTMQGYKTEFERNVEEFINDYENTVTAARIRLNGMFNQSDYPSKAEILHKFGFRTSFMPLPDNDFRIDIAASEINALKKSMENEVNDRLKNAMQDIKDRIKDQLTHMKEKLSDNDAVFRNSLFENLNDIIRLIPKLNVTDSAEVNKICEEMKTLTVADPDSVRTSAMLRSRKAQEVENILNKFEDFFS